MKKAIYIIEYIAFIKLYFLLSLFPVQTSSKLGFKLMSFIGRKTKKNNRIISQLQKYLNLDKLNSKIYSKKIWGNLGRNISELLMIKTLINQKHRFTYKNLQLSQKKGKVIISAHFSNWEIAGLPFLFNNQKTALIYRPFNNPFIEKFIKKKRSLIYAGGCFNKHTVTAQDLIRLINNGINIMLMCDQREFKGIKIDFLGHPSYTMTVPAIIALKTNSEIIAVRVKRLKNVHYSYEFIDVNITKGKNKEDSVLNIMKNINTIYNEWILSEPDEWLWTHKRWIQKK
jgi:Kdo2-lipid IVA lauroyltransferase/acyltransferase